MSVSQLDPVGCRMGLSREAGGGGFYLRPDMVEQLWT